MRPENLKAINHSFEIQAENFENNKVNFAKEEYLNHTLSAVSAGKQDTFLEVAAGTCICGRSFAPFVRMVVCLDATAPMLEIGKQEAGKKRLDNMVFVKGYAEELPFLDHSFDIVFSRLAFHHFTDVNVAFSEMVRVLKPGGKLVMIDMEAAEDTLRETEDGIETLRDPSHVKKLSKSEMLNLFMAHNLTVQTCETTEIRQRLDNWLALTKTPGPVQKEINERMLADMENKEKTGFSPYMADQTICFNQKWVLTVGIK